MSSILPRQLQKNETMILFDTVTSPNHKYLIACSTFGDIYVWNIESILNQTASIPTKRIDPLFADNDGDDDYYQTTPIQSKESIIQTTPSFVFRPYSPNIREPIYCLQTMDNLLFIGSFQCLFVYEWSNIIDAIGQSETMQNMQYLNVKPIHKYFCPQIEYGNGAKSSFVEINCIAAHCLQKSLFLGSGHSDIFQFDLTKLVKTNSFKGHSDYILDLSLNQNLLCSASNDGSIKLWNLKEAKNEICTFYGDGKVSNLYYANCCELHQNGKYLVGGFGVNAIGKGKLNKICLYELRMNARFMDIENEQNHIPQIVKFSNDWKPSNHSNLSVLAGFNNSNLCVYDKNYAKIGSKDEESYVNCTEIKTMNHSVWSVKIESLRNIAFVCGASKCVDLIANTGNSIISLTI